MWPALTYGGEKLTQTYVLLVFNVGLRGNLPTFAVLILMQFTVFYW